MQGRNVETDARVLTQLAPQEQVVREPMPLLSGGFRTDKAPPDLAPNEAVYIENLNIVAGDLSVDTGYTPFGSTFIGQAAASYQIFNPDGSSVDLLITTATIYQYDQNVVQWQLVSFGAAYSVNHAGTYPIGTTAFNLASVAGLTVGATLGVQQSDGTQIVGTITNISGTVVTISTPSTKTVNNSAPVALAATLHGDPTNETQVVFTEFPGNGWTIFSNGVDPVMYYYQGVVQVLGGLPTNTTCQAMAVFHECLILGNLIENGTSYPQRIRMSDQLNPQVWTPGTGIAAIYDLLDTEDFILSLNLLGPYLIAYRETTIMRASYFGLPNQTLYWEYMIYGEGAISQAAVSETGDVHFFVGNAGLYLYDGSYELTSIGDAVFFDYFSQGGALNPAARRTVFTQYVGDFDECWVFFPSGNDAFPRTMLRVALDNNAWFHRTFADSFVSIAPRITLQAFTWATIPGVWTDHPEPWNSRIYKQNIPNFLLCSPTQSKLMVYDYSTATDNGTVIPWQIITKEYGDGAEYVRRERWAFVGEGSNVLLEYSTDEGNTWTTIGTFGLGVGVSASMNAYVDLSTTKIMFRLSGTDPTFQLRRGTLLGVIDSEW